MRTRLLLAFAVGLAALTSRADQWMWLHQKQADEAVALFRGSIVSGGSTGVVVQYCSPCDDVPLEVWQIVDVRRVDYVDARHRTLRMLGREFTMPWFPERHSEVEILGRPVWLSPTNFAEGSYSDPSIYQPASPDASNRWDVLDLAYVFLPVGATAFRCVALEMGLTCRTHVGEVHVPTKYLDRANWPAPATTNRPKPVFEASRDR